MSIEREEGEISPIAAHRLFGASEYGKSLHGKPRWDMQRPEHISPQRWIELLGRDADNLEHMFITHSIARFFLSLDDGTLRINEDERDILLMAAISHDWGESYDLISGEGGDINYELKTNEDVTSERIVFEKVFDTVIGKVDVKTQHLIEAAIFNKKSHLGMIFDAIERLGYLRTAITAYSISKTTDDTILKGNLEWLAAGTLSNQIVTLMEYAADYAPVRECLDAASPLINEMYDTLQPEVFIEHGQAQIEKRTLYHQSKTLWNHSTTRVPEVSKKESPITSDTSNFEARFMPEYDALVRQIEACRTLGMKIVLTSGSFDLLHIGHMRYLERARSYGDILIVGVDSDEKIRERKGPDRPVIEELERVQMLSHVRGVNYITVKKSNDEKWELIKKINPDILIATSETYNPEEIEALENGYCKRVVVLEPQATTSTSARIRKMNIDISGQVILPMLENLAAGTEPSEELQNG